MTIQPIKKILVDRARDLGIKKIVLQFQGGSDNGFLEVELERGDVLNTWGNPKYQSLASDIEEWAWSVYRYSGAGDGDDYGDNITYSLDDGKAYHQSWYHEVKYEEETEEGTFEIADNDEDIPAVSVY